MRARGERVESYSPPPSAPSAHLAPPNPLSPPKAADLATALHLPSTADLLPLLVPLAASSAVTPTSAYPVGAAALGRSGAIYLGANLELPRAPLAAAVHAEQAAVACAAQAGEGGLVRIAVSAPPCGHCRQFCNELAGAEALEFVFEEAGGRGRGASASTLADLLPRAFGPADLARGPSADGSMGVAAPAGGRPATPPPGGCRARGPTFLMAGVGAGGGGGGARLEWEGEAAAVLASAAAAAAPSWDGVAASPSAALTGPLLVSAAEAALQAAASCHAPHTHCPAGVALVWERPGGGDAGPASSAPVISAGGVIESAAYNPTLPPLQAALVAAVVAGLPSWAAVRGAVLVERGGGARISHAGGTVAALACLGGGGGGDGDGAGVPLTVLRVRWA